MRKLLKPAKLLFYLLCALVFFIVGLYVAGALGAGKNQGLAGGAIVLGYGVMFSGAAFLLSIAVAFKLPHKYVVTTNWILFGLLVIGYGVTHYRYVTRERDRDTDKTDTPKTPSAPAENPPTAMYNPSLKVGLKKYKGEQLSNSPLGMGFFIPNFYEHSSIYFYSIPNFEKSLMEHSVVDSMTFVRNKYNQFEIMTAPPWLNPDILKLDYDLLYFNIRSVSEEFVEVVVNTTDGRTSFLSRTSGTIMYWPDFLLKVHSIEYPPESNEMVRVRPFETSGAVNLSYDFMKPLQVQGNWIKVLLLDQDYNKLGKGWIRWKDGKELLIRFNLLS